MSFLASNQSKLGQSCRNMNPMIELREPLEKLAIPPSSFIGKTNFRAPKDIKVYDDTLRDGEQMPGVAFSPEQKLELAIMLSDMGVHVMDVAFPVVSESDRKGLQLIAKAQMDGRIRPDVEILAMCRSNHGDIDAVVDTMKEVGANPDQVSVLVLSTISDLHMKYKNGQFLLKREGRDQKEWLDLPVEFYRRANINMITDGVAYARDRGFSRVEFAAEDASRGSLEYAIEWAKECIKYGGTRFCFSDTCGVLTPEAVDHYFPALVKALPAGFELTAHFHDDFGIGAYNCARALSHGASHAGVTANSIGERAGNASLQLTVMILKEMYGVELPGFRYDRLVELRRAIERASGIPLAPHTPIVGEGVFAHESGIHTAGIVIHPAIYQFIREETVGGDHRFVFGKHSGAAAVESVLEENRSVLNKAGVEINEELVKTLVGMVKDLREARLVDHGHEKAIDEHYRLYHALGITEEELVSLALENGKKGK